MEQHATTARARGCADRRFSWRATYRDGLVLEERGREGEAGARFEEVERERLARFSLLDAEAGREVLSLDCATGQFHVNGHVVTFLLDGRPLCGRAGTSYRHVVQQKLAHVDWRVGAACSGVVVDEHHVGYRAVVPEAMFRVVLRVDARTGAVRVEAWVTRLEPAGPRGGGFRVHVDGRAVEDGSLGGAPGAHPEAHRPGGGGS